MKYAVLAAAASLLLGAAATAFAETPTEVPKAKCEPKPVLPSARMMEEPTVRKRFQRELDDYKKCMTTYLDDRKAVIKANEVAANGAIEEYNKTMKDLTEAQKNQ